MTSSPPLPQSSFPWLSIEGEIKSLLQKRQKTKVFEVTFSLPVHWPNKEKLYWKCLSTNIISFYKMCAQCATWRNYISCLLEEQLVHWPFYFCFILIILCVSVLVFCDVWLDFKPKMKTKNFNKIQFFWELCPQLHGKCETYTRWRKRRHKH